MKKIVNHIRESNQKLPEYKLGPVQVIVKDHFTKNIDKIKILIVGDSHGRDLTRTLMSNKENLKDHEFSFLKTQILEAYESNTLININEK